MQTPQKSWRAFALLALAFAAGAVRSDEEPDVSVPTVEGIALVDCVLASVNRDDCRSADRIAFAGP